MAVDAILNIYANVASGMVVHEKVIARHVAEELPFMATENIMMDAVKRGGDRQMLHEQIRRLSLEAGYQVKELGLPNDLIDRIAAEPMFGLTKEEIETHLNPVAYIGRCPEQVEEFLDRGVKPILERYSVALEQQDSALTV